MHLKPLKHLNKMNISQLAKYRHKLLLELLAELPRHRKALEAKINLSTEAYKKYRYQNTNYQRSLRAKRPDMYPDNYARLKHYRQNCPKDYIFTVSIDALDLFDVYVTSKNTAEAKTSKNYETSVKIQKTDNFKTLLSHTRLAYKEHKVTVKTTFTYQMTQKEFYKVSERSDIFRKKAERSDISSRHTFERHLS